MCRSIKCLAHFEPPATEDEIREAALQFVRKLSGTRRPSRANQQVFDAAVEQVAQVTEQLVRALTVPGPPRNRDVEAAKARTRERYAARSI